MKLRAHPDHAATDIHPNRSRNDSADGAENSPHGRAHANVGIRHESNVRMDEGHSGELFRLRYHAGFERRRELFDVYFVIELARCDLLRAARTRHVCFSLDRRYGKQKTGDS